MAGYLGSKAVLLSTTAATVTGNATVGGSLTAGSATISGDLTVDTNTLYVDSTNNRVGIGTNLPTQNLEISDTVDATIRLTSTDNKAVFTPNVDTYGTIEFYSNDDSAGGAGIKSAIRSYVANTAGGQSALAFSTSDSSLNDVERMRIDSSGNVGIGTASPASIVGGTDTSPVLSIGGADSGLTTGDKAGSISFITNDGSYTGTYSDGVTGEIASVAESGVGGAYGLAFYTGITTGSNRAERMRIDSSGNLLVGTTNSDPALNNVSGVAAEPEGRIQASRLGAVAAVFNRQSSDGAVVQFRKDASVVGTVSVTASATSYNTSSDYRLKEDVQPMTGASERVLALNPVNFAWKSDGSRVDGFLAHEAQAVVPEAVHGEKDEVDEDGNPVYQGIDQSKLVPLLTAALQEALTEIAALKDRVTALEAN